MAAVHVRVRVREPVPQFDDHAAQEPQAAHVPATGQHATDGYDND